METKGSELNRQSEFENLSLSFGSVLTLICQDLYWETEGSERGRQGELAESERKYWLNIDNDM